MYCDTFWGRLLCSLPAEQRTIPLAAIAQATKLGDDGVEFLLMKALSLHLIEGSIDQVAGTVQVGCASQLKRLALACRPRLCS